MQKYVQYLIAFILTASMIGVANDRHVWASPQSAENASPRFETDVTEDGEYIIGGICIFRVSYKQPNLSDKAAIDVPAEISREVPFPYPDDLYLSGCHIYHYKDTKIKNEMSSEEGDWQVCFGERPDEELTIYYYADEAAKMGTAVWQALPTTKTDDGFVCAPSMYSGVYAPGGLIIPQTGPRTASADMPATTTTQVGTVMVSTTTSTRITSSGTYGAGGICELKVDYYIPGLSNELHVEEKVEVSARVPFPDNQGLLYLPGCHVYHFKTNKIVDEVTSDEGSWEICFAAIPGKETTIYFYYSDDDSKRVTSVWTPLKTRVEGGQACAPTTEFTGVYTPVGK